MENRIVFDSSARNIKKLAALGFARIDVEHKSKVNNEELIIELVFTKLA